jgi:hypothetical protein
METVHFLAAAMTLLAPARMLAAPIPGCLRRSCSLIRTSSSHALRAQLRRAPQAAKVGKAPTRIELV